jgi:aspartate racemase
VKPIGLIGGMSCQRFRSIIDTLGTLRAEGVILGCTEIGLLIGPGDVELPTFDTTRLHAKAAVSLALEIS